MKPGKIIKLALLIGIPAAAAVLFLAKKRVEPEPSSFSPPAGRRAYANAKTYPTWEDYLSSKDWEKAQASPRTKVVFIGMDGATWNVIDPMLEAGNLPSMRRLKREGSYGTLRSVECYISPPAWVTMMTGVLPNKSGVYTFGKWDEKNHKFDKVSIEDVRAPAVWDIASLAGKRTAVTNIPITYPAQKVNGIMVSGMLTPISLEEKRPVFARRLTDYSGGLLESLGIKTYSEPLETNLNLYDNLLRIVLYDSHDDEKTDYDSGIIGVLSTREKQRGEKRVTCYDFHPGTYSPWLNIDFSKDGSIRGAWCQLKITVPQFPICKIRGSPVFIAPDDPDVYNTYPADFSKVLKKQFKYYFPYTPFDKDQIPDFARDATGYASFFYEMEDWDLFLYAFLGPDRIHHREGFSQKTREVYSIIDEFIGKLMDRLPDDAVLIVASDHGFKGYEYSIDMNSFLANLGLLRWGKGGSVDYDKTLVYYNMYSIFFNHSMLSVKELNRRGIPLAPNETPKQALSQYLREKAAGIKDPKTGRNMPVELFSVPDNALGKAPDLFVTGGYDDYNVELWDYKNPHQNIVYKLKDGENWAHRRDGIYYLWGKNIKQGFDAGIKDIQDISPTILYLLNLPLAGNFDGKIMENVLEPGVFTKRPVALVDKYADIARTSVLPDDDREAMEKKLKSLGYIR